MALLIGEALENPMLRNSPDQEMAAVVRELVARIDALERENERLWAHVHAVEAAVKVKKSRKRVVNVEEGL